MHSTINISQRFTKTVFKKLILFTALASSTLLAKNINYDFEKTDLSKWNTYGKWEITTDNKEHCLSMLQRSAGRFNLCYTKDANFTDGNISVEFKANRGRIDQGGGVMWRVQDNDNYYVARFNPLEDNFRFYIVHDGIRSELASVDIKLSSGWHTMKIEQKGDIFKGYIDNKQELEDKNAQLKKAGGVGVWTKADAQTSFDNLKIETSR